jgi:hypothetical protein
MINNRGVALDGAIHVQVASKAGIGDFLIFKAPDCQLNCDGRLSSVPQAAHSYFGGTWKFG